MHFLILLISGALILFILIIFVYIKILGVFVIIEKAVEIQRNHSCYQFFARKPAELFEHHRQIVVDVVAHDVDFFEIVDMAEQLFLANLLRCRDETAFHRLSELLLDSFDFMFFLLVHETDTDTGLVGTSGSAATVHVSVDIVGEVVVDDMCQVVHVQSAGCHVGSHQNLGETLAEMVHHQVALCLR